MPAGPVDSLGELHLGVAKLSQMTLQVQGSSMHVCACVCMVVCFIVHAMTFPLMQGRDHPNVYVHILHILEMHGNALYISLSVELM